MARQPHHSSNYGGARPGAGRGFAPDRYSKDLVRQAHENGIHPFTFLLTIMRDDTKEEKMRIYAANACMPYCAQKLVQTEVKITSELDGLTLAEKVALATSLRATITESRPEMTLPQLPVIEGEASNGS